MNTGQKKKEIRERIWSLLESAEAAPTGVHGYIPAFFGAQQAADILASLPAWRTAKVVKAVPDTAQEPVRARALREGKLLYMAVPRLAEQKPFVLLDPTLLAISPEEAACNKTALQVGRQLDVDEMRPIDLIVCGSVAVNRKGVRLGKGAGYSDIEVAILQEAGLIGPNTTIVTTVHHLQVLDDDLPEAQHDFRVDIIVTPNEFIRCPEPKRPRGLDWADLPAEKIAAIPALMARQGSAGGEQRQPTR